MTPNPDPVVEPELKEVNKVETKSVLNTESVTKPSDAGSDVMVLIKFKCTVDKCPFETDNLEATLAAKLLGIHSEANHVCGAPNGPRDKLQKLDQPVLRTGCSQQDF